MCGVPDVFLCKIKKLCKRLKSQHLKVDGLQRREQVDLAVFLFLFFFTQKKNSLDS